MRLLAALFVAVMGLAGVASPVLAADCGTVTGWVGIPLCTQGGAQVAVPTVVGEASSAAAATVLQAEGLDVGTVTERCSAVADNAVIGQDPAPGVFVDLGELVDLLVSNGVDCPNSGRQGVRLRGLRMPGL